MIPIKSNKCQIYLDRSLGETSLAIIIMSSDTVFFPAVSGQWIAPLAGLLQLNVWIVE